MAQPIAPNQNGALHTAVTSALKAVTVATLPNLAGSAFSMLIDQFRLQPAAAVPPAPAPKTADTDSVDTPVHRAPDEFKSSDVPEDRPRTDNYAHDSAEHNHPAVEKKNVQNSGQAVPDRVEEETAEAAAKAAPQATAPETIETAPDVTAASLAPLSPAKEKASLQDEMAEVKPVVAGKRTAAQPAAHLQQPQIKPDTVSAAETAVQQRGAPTASQNNFAPDLSLDGDLDADILPELNRAIARHIENLGNAQAGSAVKQSSSTDVVQTVQPAATTTIASPNTALLAKTVAGTGAQSGQHSMQFQSNGQPLLVKTDGTLPTTLDDNLSSGFRNNLQSQLVKATAAPQARAGTNNTPAMQVALSLQRGIQNGATRMSIRMDPPELGRVDVRLEVSGEGRVVAHVATDRPETNDLLQRDARFLEKVLQDAGMNTDSDSLKFTLRQNHDQAKQGSNAPTEDPERSGADDDADSNGIMPDDVLHAVLSQAGERGIDIRI